MELTARNIAAGTIRLVHAVFYAFLLAYGLQMGNRVYTSLGGQEVESSCGANPISPWLYIPLLPVLSLSIGMSYGSSVRQWPAQLGGSLITFCISYFLGKLVPDNMPAVNTVASFAIGLYSHLLLKLWRLTPLITVSVGVTLLVPGSIGKTLLRLEREEAHKVLTRR